MIDYKQARKPKKGTKQPADKQNRRTKQERKIDDEIEQSFPASDPPSYSQPGNDDVEKT